MRRAVAPAFARATAYAVGSRYARDIGGRVALRPKDSSASRWSSKWSAPIASTATWAVMSHVPSGTGAVARPSRNPAIVPPSGRSDRVCP
jgi:hypothetical protein